MFMAGRAGTWVARRRTLCDAVKMPTAFGMIMTVFIFTTSVTDDTAILICNHASPASHATHSRRGAAFLKVVCVT